MSKKEQRLKKVEERLTPKQSVLLWMQDAHRFPSLLEYCRWLKDQPDQSYPLMRMPEQMEKAIGEAMKGTPREVVDRAVREAVKDVAFLFHVHQQINLKFLEDDKVLSLRLKGLIDNFRSLMRERNQKEDMDFILWKIGQEISYPLDPETGAAVEAALKNHVTTWQTLEEGGTIEDWIFISLLDKGATRIPYAAYDVKENRGPTMGEAMSKEELRALFKDEKSFLAFLDGSDHTCGLADVTDAEFNAHYDGIVKAMHRLVEMGEIKEGKSVTLDNVPIMFLKDVPLVESEWVDRCIVELAEWGVLLQKKGYRFEEFDLVHPLEIPRIVRDTSEGEMVELAEEERASLWDDSRKRVAKLKLKVKQNKGSPYVQFEEYTNRLGKTARNELKESALDGLVLQSWNEWVEQNGAVLEGIAVESMTTIVDGYRWEVLEDTEEANAKLRERVELLEPTWSGNRRSMNQEKFLARISEWKVDAEEALRELHTVLQCHDGLSQSYFDGQEVLFPAASQRLSELLEGVEGLAGLFNNGFGREHEASVDSETLAQASCAAAKDLARYLTDMSKAEALQLIGDQQAAIKYVAPHV